MEIIDIVMQVLAQFASALPSIIGAIVVALLGWLIAKIVSKALLKILASLKIDTLAKHLNETEFIKKANLKIIPSRLLSSIIYYVLLLVFLVAAADVLQVPVVSSMIADLIAYLPRLFAALLLFILGILLSDFIKNMTLTTCTSLGIPSAKLIANFVFYLVFLTLAISALQQAGIATELISLNLTVLLSGVILAFAIGYGLASRDTMANFLASFYTKKKVKIGDVIRFEESKGEVVAMDSASITIKSENSNSLVVIPMKRFMSGNVEIFGH